MKTLAPWIERPTEEARLFNPAFGAFLIARASDGFKAEKSSPMPIALVYLVLPAILPRETRRLLPAKSNASLVAWTTANADEVSFIARRAVEAAALTREALIFGVAHRCLGLDGGGVMSGASPFPKTAKLGADEADECARRANTFGRWIANAGTPSTVMSLFGVRP